jgi:predicted DNA-binding transcriptional regulator YafY
MTWHRRAVEIVYRNWRGETAPRRIVPLRLVFRRSAYKPGPPRWALEARCLERQARRSFVLEDILRWTETPR